MVIIFVVLAWETLYNLRLYFYCKFYSKLISVKAKVFFRHEIPLQLLTPLFSEFFVAFR